MEIDLLLAALGAVLTLFIFSYLLGDNPLYRLALHIFVGASVAYVFVVALRNIILPALTPPDTSDADIRVLWTVSLVGVLLGALLLMRSVRGLSWLSEIPVAILFLRRFGSLTRRVSSSPVTTVDVLCLVRTFGRVVAVSVLLSPKVRSTLCLYAKPWVVHGLSCP